jgi:transcriptional antiterminator NusG
MNYYALQVKTRAEENFIRLFSRANVTHQTTQFRLIFLKRAMPVKKAGIIQKKLEPIFPGYIFLESESFSNAIRWAIRTMPGFFRFLPETRSPKPLEGRDLATLKHFLSFGNVAERSIVRFDDNDRIVVQEGPLKGLEGRIVKVDKRKGRAKVKLDMYDEAFLIDLAFEVLDTKK